MFDAPGGWGSLWFLLAPLRFWPRRGVEMPRQSHILAVDLGTGGPKVALVARDGAVIADAFAPTPLIHVAGGGVEQDPAGWWTAVVDATRNVLGDAPDARRSIAAIAVTAQWATVVPVAEDGTPTMNALSWLDPRGGAHARAIAGGRLRVAGYGPLKLLRWIRMTGGAPSLSGHDPVGQILFIRNTLPDVYERTRAFLEPVDYLTLRMTGRTVTTPETATLHWATDTRRIDDVHYDEKLIAMSALDREKLPDLVPGGSVVGELSDAAAAELGLDAVPVIAGTPDIMSAAIGAGAVADGAPHLYVGTSAWLSCHLPYKKTDVLHNIAALPSAVLHRYLVCTEQQSAGGALSHLRDNLLGLPGIDFADLIAEAAAVPAGADGLMFTPWINGERTPLDDHNVRGAYANISLTTTRGALVRATLEGVALNVRWMQEHVERFIKGRVDDIAFIGGAASSPLWCQIFADVLDRDIRRIVAPRQANARGAALHAAVALGWISWEDVPKLVQTEHTYRPDPANRGLYDELFGEFRGFYKANRKMYARLNSRRTCVPAGSEDHHREGPP